MAAAAALAEQSVVKFVSTTRSPWLSAPRRGRSVEPDMFEGNPSSYRDMRALLPPATTVFETGLVMTTQISAPIPVSPSTPTTAKYCLKVRP